MLYKIFITLAIISKILDEGQMGPTPKILNSYFKSDFDSFFLFRFFMKFPACIFQKRFDLALVVSLQKLTNSQNVNLFILLFKSDLYARGVTFYPNTPKYTQIHHNIVFIVLV